MTGGEWARRFFASANLMSTAGEQIGRMRFAHRGGVEWLAVDPVESEEPIGDGEALEGSELPKALEAVPDAILART